MRTRNICSEKPRFDSDVLRPVCCPGGPCLAGRALWEAVGEAAARAVLGPQLPSTSKKSTLKERGGKLVPFRMEFESAFVGESQNSLHCCCAKLFTYYCPSLFYLQKYKIKSIL